MKIAIAGNGIAGAYTYKLLASQGHEIVIYHVPVVTQCGIKPCAWGTSAEILGLIAHVGLNPDKYILNYIDTINLDGLEMKANLYIIDKPKLIIDLLRGACMVEGAISEQYDVIIDATGTARAYLPPSSDDLVLRCVQVRINRHIDKVSVKLCKIGYSWQIPCGNECHVGAESYVKKPVQSAKGDEILCGCASGVRVSGLLPPFVAGNVWGVGEAIGVVAPLAGDGIVTGMQSAQVMVECLEHNGPDGYRKQLYERFAWIQREREVLGKLIAGKTPSVWDAGIITKNAKRMGLEINTSIALRMLWKWMK